MNSDTYNIKKHLLNFFDQSQAIHLLSTTFHQLFKQTSAPTRNLIISQEEMPRGTMSNINLTCKIAYRIVKMNTLVNTESTKKSQFSRNLSPLNEPINPKECETCISAMNVTAGVCWGRVQGGIISQG